MRRSLGGLLMLVAGGFFAVSIGLFWMDRVAFSPSADTDTAFAVMGNEDIREQIATLVANVDAPLVGQSPVVLRDFIEFNMTNIREAATPVRETVADAHARVIGDSEDPVTITAAEQVRIVLDEHVALQPDITLPVDEVGALSIVNTVTVRAWLIGFGLGVLTMLVGFLVRPERGEFAFAFGLGCLATGAALVVFGYLIPVTLLPAVSRDVWTGLFPRLAYHRRNLTLVGALAFAGIGAVIVFGTSGLRRRRQRSTPLAVGRFREQQRWSP